jgi:small nuclear ribonucleoprotein (snRNP)-like protein
MPAQPTYKLMSEKVVLRFQDGSTIKGSLGYFSEIARKFSIEKYPSGNLLTVSIDLLKAIFFVRSFEGNPSYRELKRYGISREKGRKVYVKFKDKESLLGYLEGEFPWQKGYFLSKSDKDKTGFFLIPVDEGCNNIKIFVVGTAIDDITLI